MSPRSYAQRRASLQLFRAGAEAAKRKARQKRHAAMTDLPKETSERRAALRAICDQAARDFAAKPKSENGATLGMRVQIQGTPVPPPSGFPELSAAAAEPALARAVQSSLIIAASELSA